MERWFYNLLNIFNYVVDETNYVSSEYINVQGLYNYISINEIVKVYEKAKLNKASGIDLYFCGIFKK
jgi:hypothetical protein